MKPVNGWSKLESMRYTRSILDHYWHEIRPANIAQEQEEKISKEVNQLETLTWEKMKAHEHISQISYNYHIHCLKETVNEFRHFFQETAEFVLEWPLPPGLNYYPPEAFAIRAVIDRLENRCEKEYWQLNIFQDQKQV